MGDNGRRKGVLEFDLSDAPMLADMLSYAAARAILDSNDWAKDRFDEYAQVLEAMIPDEARHFAAMDWAEMAAALSRSSRFRTTLVPAFLHDKHFHKGRIQIEIWGETDEPLSWRSEKHDFRKGDEAIRAVHDVIAEMAPMDCNGEIEDFADEAGYRW